ncbi:MAG: hypothetical protein NC221_02520 [Duncaniella sp.]|nr:hypothetical protein [Muribaculum sp.]MCM1254974.1 hypothetical protein [Duncaniella sp.]
MLIILLVSCKEQSPVKQSIYSCDEFEVYPDSLVRGKISFNAMSPWEISNSWNNTSRHESQLSFFSAQPLGDALFNKATTEKPSFTPLQIYLSLAATHPHESMDALRALVKGGIIISPDFPVAASNCAWAIAAWEVYCVTGDKSWLREAYKVITSTLRRQLPVVVSQLSPLIYGASEHLIPYSEFYPEWMSPINRFQTISTSVNAFLSQTYTVLIQMADELGYADIDDYHKRASEIRSKINDLMWMPNLGFYGQYLYGDYYPILSHSTDQIANSLCILFDIATPEMASSIVARSPILPQGAPLVYPAIKSTNAENPLVQVLRALSAAKVRNEKAIVAAVAAMWNIAVDHSIPAESQSLVLKGLLGMAFTPKGISFSPMLPSLFPGRKTLSNFRYRDSELTISVRGTGDRIAGFFIDSVSKSPAFVPADLVGKHNIDITLSGNDLPETNVTMVPTLTLPETPVLKWVTPSSAHISNFKLGMSYGIYLNGVFLEEIQSDTYTYTPNSTAIIDIVPIADQKYIGFSPLSHIIAPLEARINIPATSITPRRTPLHLINHRETATKYIELAARHNTRITFYANAPEAGEYFINIGYSNGTGETAMRTISVNGKDVGILVCPSLSRTDWVTVHPSNTLTVKLNAGPNQLALTYLNTTILLNRITLLKKE